MYFGYLTLKVTNVRLETIGGSHLDEEEVVVVLLGVLREEQLDKIFEVVN